jgi:hypothetical protein
MSHAGHTTEIDCMCTDCKLRYPKTFTHEAWMNLRKLDSTVMVQGKEYYRDTQEILCKKYNVTITGYLTPRERKILFMKKIWWGFNRILDKIKGSKGGMKGVVVVY